MSTLQEITIINYLSTTSKQSIKQIITGLDEKNLLRMKNIVDEEDKKRIYWSYVVVSTNYSSFGISSRAFEFIKKYRPKIKYESLLARNDPILVLMVALLGKAISSACLNIDVDYVSRYMKYNIETQNDRYGNFRDECVKYKESKKIRLIPARPNNLFKEIEKFANENNLVLNIKNAEKQLADEYGDYRVYD